MRKFYVCVSLIIVSALTFALAARSLTPDQALQRALQSGSSVLKSPQLGGSSPILSLTRTIDNEPAVYVFNKGDNTGFYVISADDNTEALLGYADCSSISADIDKLPPALLYWLDEYARQIAFSRQNGSQKVLKAGATAERAAIAPQVTTEWNQGSPYNDLCPSIDGTKCYTGCMATAMAQVMNYHEWPVQGVGSNSYEWNNTTLSLDFTTGVYDWANMTDTYSSASTDVENTAVATLMYHCGIASNMNYGTSASGATSTNALQGMVNYFGYSKAMVLMSRDFYTITDWNDEIYAQLVNYGPVLYTGYNNEGGHAFVCDGYSSDDFFHINWGWGGMSDGYFKLNALNPDSQGIGGSSSGYNSGQAVIANIKKDEGETATPYLCLQEFSTSSASATLGDKI